MLFCTEDPERNGWGLSLGSGQQTDIQLVSGAYLSPEQVSVSMLVNWKTAITLLLHADDHGIGTFFDSDGQWMISGYALHAAGVIDSALNPTTELTAEEAREWKLGMPPSEALATIVVLRMYAEFVSEQLRQLAGEPGCEQEVLNLQDHLRGAVQWLLENGHIEHRSLAAGSTLVN